MSEQQKSSEPRAGVLLSSYRLSLKGIEKTGTTVGGTAIGSLRLIGLPRRVTAPMQRGQAGSLRRVTQWSDDVGTGAAHGIGKAKTLAKQGTRKGAKTWVRGMKFFITLH